MKRADLIAAVVAHTRRPDPRRRLALVRPGFRLCAWAPCGQEFRPTTAWQKYHTAECRVAAWAAEHPERVHRRKPQR